MAMSGHNGLQRQIKGLRDGYCSGNMPNDSYATWDLRPPEGETWLIPWVRFIIEGMQYTGTWWKKVGYRTEVGDVGPALLWSIIGIDTYDKNPEYDKILVATHDVWVRCQAFNGTGVPCNGASGQVMKVVL